MQVVEKFSTKVKSSVVKSYLLNYYRSQDYRTEAAEDKIIVIPYSVLTPFTSIKKASSIHRFEYDLTENGGVTEISFLYQIAFCRKVLSLVLPIAIFGVIYLSLKMMIGTGFVIGSVFFAVIITILALYSYLQTKNFVNHITEKNQKLLNEMELFALNHVGSGLMSESFTMSEN